MKPGVDYKQTFTDFALSILRRKNQEESEKMINELSLNKSQLQTLLIQMGILMKPPELASLIDAFDANGDGVITIQEFLDFTGPCREKKGGASLQMNQRCAWNTTCKITGMANAFAVSTATKRSLRSGWIEEKEKAISAIAEEKVEDHERSRKYDASVAQSKDGGMGGVQAVGDDKIFIRTLRNGEKRIVVEKSERAKRLEILKRFRVIATGAGGGAATGGGGGGDHSEAKAKKSHEDEDEYEGDFEDGGRRGGGGGGDEYNDDFDQDNGEGENSSQHTKSRNQCAFIRWTNEDRNQALKYLNDLSKSNRQEHMMKEMMENGSPPSKPLLETFIPNDQV